MLVEEESEESRVEGSGSIEEVSLGFRRMDRRISLGADLFLSTSLNSLTRMVGRRGSSGPYPILMIEKATSNGHRRADYEQPLREGKIEGGYALEVGRKGLEGLGKAVVNDISPTFTFKNQDPVWCRSNCEARFKPGLPIMRTMKVCFIIFSLVYVMCGYNNAIIIAFISIIQATIKLATHT